MTKHEEYSALVAFHLDGASMSEAQWCEHLKDADFRAWLADNAPQIAEANTSPSPPSGAVAV